MIYRRTPPQPGRLLLRIVATTGAGTLLGVVACGSTEGFTGALGNPHTDAEVSGSTGSASGSASTGYEASGSTGSAGGTAGTGCYIMGVSGNCGLSQGMGDDDAGSTDASSSDATLEAGRIILGISVAPPDAGSEQ